MNRNRDLKPLKDQGLTALAQLCENVARSGSANPEQWKEAHTLRVEWIRLNLKGWPGDSDSKAENESLRKRMVQFLVGIPGWMMNGA